MKALAKYGLIFLSGFALCGALVWSLDAQLHPPDKPLGAVPNYREAVLVLKWLSDHRPDARELEYVVWWPPLEVRDNPLTRAPATLVHVVFRNQRSGPDGEMEDLLFFVKNDTILGHVRNGDGAADPRMPRKVGPGRATAWLADPDHAKPCF